MCRKYFTKKHTGIVTIGVVPGSYAIKIAIMLIYKGTGQAIDYKDAKEIIKRGHKDHIERKLFSHLFGDFHIS